jgi:hypothetical protein
MDSTSPITSNWLSIAWTSIFAVYAAAVLPLLGWAIAHAL